MSTSDQVSDPVSELDEFQGVDRCIPFIFRPLQGEFQLLGAAYAASHQDQAAEPNNYSGDHPNRYDGDETER